jgi:polyisoprenoid-binding protein YceI
VNTLYFANLTPYIYFLRNMTARLLLILFCIFYNSIAYSQIYVCKDGWTKFTSEAPLELIKAENTKSKGVLDASTKNVVFSMQIDNFNGFNGDLQKEHFLENYMESVKYPTVEFKGKIIEDVSLSNDGNYLVRVKGSFKIHGITKEQIIKVNMTVKDAMIDAESKFEILLSDYDIKIPKIVHQKIASVITVEVKARLKPKT